MPTETDAAPALALDGRPLAVGEIFTPFPDEHPGYTLMYAGVHNGRARLAERHNGVIRVFSVPLADIPDAE